MADYQLHAFGRDVSGLLLFLYSKGPRDYLGRLLILGISGLPNPMELPQPITTFLSC